MSTSATPTGMFLRWLLQRLDYDTVIVLKNSLTDISAFIFGFIAATIVACFFLRNVRVIDNPDGDEMTITRMEKNGVRMKFVSIPTPIFSTISCFVAFLHIAYVKLFRKEKVQIVNTRKVRIAWTVTLLIIVAVCIFNILLDSRVILPVDNNYWGVFDLHGNLHGEPISK
jgi:amino acid permease